VRFDQRGLIWHCGTVAATPNRRPVSLIGRQRPGRHHHRFCSHASITFLLTKMPL
jgi:hypothetical protein